MAGGVGTDPDELVPLEGGDLAIQPRRGTHGVEQARPEEGPGDAARAPGERLAHPGDGTFPLAQRGVVDGQLLGVERGVVDRILRRLPVAPQQRIGEAAGGLDTAQAVQARRPAAMVRSGLLAGTALQPVGGAQRPGQEAARQGQLRVDHHGRVGVCDGQLVLPKADGVPANGDPPAG